MVETAGHLDNGGDAVEWGGDGDSLGGAVPETKLTVLVSTKYKHFTTFSAGWGEGGGQNHNYMAYMYNNIITVHVRTAYT